MIFDEFFIGHCAGHISIGYGISYRSQGRSIVATGINSFDGCFLKRVNLQKTMFR